MSMTGTLSMNGTAKVDGTLLARDVPGRDPYGAAKDFMRNHGCDNNNCVTVDGTMKDGAFWLDDAHKESDTPCVKAAAAFALKQPAKSPKSPKAVAAQSTAKTAKKAPKKAARKRTRK